MGFGAFIMRGSLERGAVSGRKEGEAARPPSLEDSRLFNSKDNR
jgi:hypothetical protein